MSSNGIDLDRLIELLPGRTISYSDYLATQCIFHDDERPSLLIHSDYYKCLSCGAQGKTSFILQKLTKNTNPIPVKREFFSNPFTEWTKSSSLPQALKLAWENLKRSPSHYLKNRGIPVSTQIQYGLGLRDGWITFPIRDIFTQKIIGAVARAGEDMNQKSKYVTPANQNPNLLYIPDIKLFNCSKHFFLTFGIIDAITLNLYGWAAASTTNGKRIDPIALDKYRKLIIFIPDRGEESEALLIASKLGWRGKVISVNYPMDCKDISDIHKNHRELLEKQRLDSKGAKWL